MIRIAYVKPMANDINWLVANEINVEPHSRNWVMNCVDIDKKEHRELIHPSWIVNIKEYPEGDEHLYNFAQSELRTPINAFAL